MTDKKITEQARVIYNHFLLMREKVFQAMRRSPAFMKNKRLGGLTLPQAHAVLAVHAHGWVTVSRLAEILDVSPPSVSVMADRLVEKGVLERRQCKDDRRKVQVCVSADGLEIIETLENLILSVFAELAEKLGPESTGKWIKGIEKVNRVLEDKPPP